MTKSAATASERTQGQQGTGNAGASAKLGLASGQVVQEIGWDEDVDDAFRESIEEITGGPLEDDDYDGGAEAVLLWWRDGDGDLADDVMDALSSLVDGGFIVLMTPRTGTDGFVEPADIMEAATVSSLTASTGMPVGAWMATRLVSTKGPRK